MCDTIDGGYTGKNITNKMIKEVNKDSKYFFSQNKNLIKTIKDEFKNRLYDEEYKSIPSRFNKYIYRYIREKGESHGRYVIINGCKEITILDCEKLSKKYKYFNLQSFEFNNAETHIILSIDTTGSGICKIFVKEYFNNKLKFLNIDGVGNIDAGAFAIKYRTSGDILWSPKQHKVYYIVIDDSLRPNQLWYYDLNSDEHECIYEEKDESYSLSLVESDDRSNLILASQSKSSADSFIILEESNSLKCLFKREEGLRVSLNHFGGLWYVLLLKQNNSEILLSSDLVNYKIFLPYSSTEYILELYLKGGYGLIKYQDLNTGQTKYKLKDLCNFQEFKLEFDDYEYNIEFPPMSNLDIYNPEVVLSYETRLIPDIYFRFNYKTLKLEEVMRIKTKNYNPDDFGEKQVKINNEGVLLTILYNKKNYKSTNNNCVLYGYGAYGLDDEPYFNKYIPSLLDRGYIYCIAHIRGGGKYGEKWYEDGKMLKKMNSFKDFIACAEYLIDNKLTSKNKLVASGASAGGLLVGASINLRPDLFNLAIMGVPFIDVLTEMCNPDIPLTTEEYKEWGNPGDPKYFNAMKAYDPIRNIDITAPYPNIFIYTNKNDSLVGYWVPFNYYMKMKNADVFKNNERKINIYINSKYGHQGSSDIDETREERAEVYAVILKQNV